MTKRQNKRPDIVVYHLSQIHLHNNKNSNLKLNRAHFISLKTVSVRGGQNLIEPSFQVREFCYLRQLDTPGCDVIIKVGDIPVPVVRKMYILFSERGSRRKQ